MEQLKILVAGAGAVGGYIASKLALNFYDVTMLVRTPAYNKIKRDGLLVYDYKDEFIVHPTVTHTIPNETFDVVFITTKSFDVETIAKEISSCVDEKTIIIPLSDGVEHKNTISNILPNSIVAQGCIYLIASKESQNTVKKSSLSFYLLYGSDVKDERLMVLKQILDESGLRTNYSNHIEYECWKKFMFISSTSALCTYFDCTIDTLVDEKIEEFIDLLLEIVKVANKKDIKLTQSDIEKTIKQANHTLKGTKTVMQKQLENSKEIQLYSLVGYIVDEAKKLDVDVPNFDKIYECLLNKKV